MTLTIITHNDTHHNDIKRNGIRHSKTLNKKCDTNTMALGITTLGDAEYCFAECR